MKKLILIPLLFISSSAFALYENVVNCTGLSQVVNANNSAAIQACLNQGATLSSTINLPAGTYFISGAAPLQPASNTKLVGNNTTIKIIPNNLTTYQAILISGKTNVIVQNIELVGDRLLHTNTGGEFGMGVQVQNSSNITVNNVRASEFWGDGFFVGNSRSTNVNLIDVVASKNRRQGISITAVAGMYVRGSFINTGVGTPTCVANQYATPPCAGIDIEPDSRIDTTTGALMKVSGLTIEASTISGNLGNGIKIIAFNAGQLSNTTSDIVFRTNTILNNLKPGIFLSSFADKIQVYGNTIASQNIGAMSLEGARNNVIYGNSFGQLGASTNYAVNVLNAANANNQVSYNAAYGFGTRFAWFAAGSSAGATLTANTVKP
jgi:hypothetical protein